MLHIEGIKKSLRPWREMKDTSLTALGPLNVCFLPLWSVSMWDENVWRVGGAHLSHVEKVHLCSALVISSISTKELSEEFLLPCRSLDKLLPRLPARLNWGQASLERERPRSGTNDGDIIKSRRTFNCLTRTRWLWQIMLIFKPLAVNCRVWRETYFFSSDSLSRRCLSWM